MHIYLSDSYYFEGKVRNVTYINTVDPVTDCAEGTVTGDVIEQHHLVTKICQQTLHISGREGK